MTNYLLYPQNLFAWVFMPLAWVMGVDWSECDKVGELIGLKTVINEFVAYSKLGDMKEAGELSVSHCRPFVLYS